MDQKPLSPIRKAALQILQALVITAPPKTITGGDLLHAIGEGEDQQEPEETHG